MVRRPAPFAITSSYTFILDYLIVDQAAARARPSTELHPNYGCRGDGG